MTICSESDVFTNKADDGAWCQALVRGLEGYTLCVKWDGTRLVTGAQLKAAVVHRDTNNIDFVRIVSCGHEIYDASILEADKYGHLPPCQAILRVLGGKGGFGSLLRGAGKGKNVSDNNDACRDLSGRRLRHVNAEKKLQEWKEDSKERDLEVVARQFIKKQKIHEKEVEQKQAALVEVANESAERLRGVAQSVRSGLRQEKSLLQVASAKRSAEQEEGAQPGPSKRPTFMWGLDDDVNSEEDSDTDGELDRAGHVDETLSENPIKIALAPSTPPPVLACHFLHCPQYLSISPLGPRLSLLALPSISPRLPISPLGSGVSLLALLSISACLPISPLGLVINVWEEYFFQFNRSGF